MGLAQASAAERSGTQTITLGGDDRENVPVINYAQRAADAAALLKWQRQNPISTPTDRIANLTQINSNYGKWILTGPNASRSDSWTWQVAPGSVTSGVRTNGTNGYSIGDTYKIDNSKRDMESLLADGSVGYVDDRNWFDSGVNWFGEKVGLPAGIVMGAIGAGILTGGVATGLGASAAGAAVAGGAASGATSATANGASGRGILTGAAMGAISGGIANYATPVLSSAIGSAAGTGVTPITNAAANTITNSALGGTTAALKGDDIGQGFASGAVNGLVQSAGQNLTPEISNALQDAGIGTTAANTVANALIGSGASGLGAAVTGGNIGEAALSGATTSLVNDAVKYGSDSVSSGLKDIGASENAVKIMNPIVNSTLNSIASAVVSGGNIGDAALSGLKSGAISSLKSNKDYVLDKLGSAASGLGVKIPDSATNWIPNINLSGIVPRINLSGVVPRINLSGVIPKTNISTPQINVPSASSALTIPKNYKANVLAKMGNGRI